MSDTRLTIFQSDGTTAAIDYRTESTNGDGRQVIVFGDPSINANVAAVQGSDPSSNTQGIVVRDINTSAIAGFLNGSLSIYLQATSGTLNVQLKPGTIAVSLDPGHLLGSITANAGTGSFNVQFDPGHTLGKVEPGVGTFQVFLPDTGHEIGTIRGNTNTLTIFLPDTGHTLGKVDQGVASSTQPWLVNTQGTASIFTVSGSVSGVSVSGNTIISPSANASFKIFSFSIQTTGQVSLTTKFTNGAGTSPTEFYRPLITAAGVTGAQGANLVSAPFAPLFITGTSTTLALVLDSATLVHYSVSYIKESA